MAKKFTVKCPERRGQYVLSLREQAAKSARDFLAIITWLLVQDEEILAERLWDELVGRFV
jgi:phage terminase Nu1 subunit (DNA packaging protein)